ncbi:MAG: PAS domain S-box protein [Solirubrobacterales bacterium]|nr:PAS domain S-box protein [Solirubrobacterales bacterium]
MGIGAFEQVSLSADGLASLLDAAVEACALLDGDGRILGWNQAAQSMFGWRAEEVLGSDMAPMIVAEESCGAYRNAVTRVMSDGDHARVRCELLGTRRDGASLQLEVVFGLLDEHQPRLVAFMLDISERKEAAARQQQFEAIVASSGDAIFSGPLDGTIESWNPAAERLYGYTADEMIGESVTRLLPGGSFDDVKPQRQALREGRSISLEAKERHKDGRLVDVALTIAPLRDEMGEVSGVVSVVRDVGERIEAANRLAEAHERFAAAFRAASIGMALVAPDGRFLDVNPALCALLGRDSRTLRACTFSEITHPADLAEGVAQVQQALTGEIDSFRQSKRYLLPDGGIVWGLLTVTVARDADGRPRHFVAQIEDITDRKTAEGEVRRYGAQLEALSERDPLTGGLNQRGFDAAASDALRVWQGGGMGCGVLLLEIEGDDDTVATVADAVVALSREGDRLAHLGGGRLAVLLADVDERKTRAAAKRIRALVRRPEIVRTAWAVARRADTARSLLQRASRALTGEDARPPGPHAARAPAPVERLLELARDQLGMPIAFLARLEGRSYVFERFAGGPEPLEVREGSRVPLAATNCQRMLDGRIGSTVADLAAEPATRDLYGTIRWGLRAYAGVPIRLRSGRIYGTLCAVDTRPHHELTRRHSELLRFLSELAADLIDADAEQQVVRRAEATASGVRALLVALEARDFYTGEHSREVVTLATAVSKRLGLEPNAIRDVEQVSLLHDIGKVGIPDAVLQKQGPLDEQEWQLMRQHPIVGEHIIAGIPALSHLALAMRAEHERWDGNGYPDGLAGDKIPLASRITLACDALNAMTSDRPYRPAMSLERARDELHSNSGTQFDPQVIRALLAELGSRSESRSIRAGDRPPSATA